MFIMSENGRTFFCILASRTLKDARTVMNHVRKNVNFCFIPINKFAIKPYFTLTETHRTLLGLITLTIIVYPFNSNKKKLKIAGKIYLVFSRIDLIPFLNLNLS